MTRRLSVPPGRAWPWLLRRVETARRGADLLDRKLRILQIELEARREVAARTAAHWDSCQRDAQQWLVRAALLGGQRALRLAADDTPAQVTVSYDAVMGIRYPAEATCVIPPSTNWEGPALTQARNAHRAALAAAVAHAVAAEALRVIEAETLITRYRLRAVRDRRIPQLEQALAEVTFAIEELERADAARLRLARGQR